MKNMGKVQSHIRKGMACVAALAVMLMSGTFAFANNSPDDNYVTDSSHVLISEADTSIEDISNLMLGDSPAEVLGDSSLAGYSTLAVFSVTAIDDYDFQDAEMTEIRGASLTSDMTVQVRFLPTGGDWSNIKYTVSDDVLEVQFPSEGQIAIFVKDEINIADMTEDATTGKTGSEDVTTEAVSTESVSTEEQKPDYVKAPQTGDALPLYIGMGVIALAAVAVSVKKIKK